MKTYKPRELKDQVIVITGASSGIGLATAQMAAKAGAQVVMNARNAEALENCVQEIISQGGKALGVPGDIADIETSRRIKESAFEAWGRIDTWVNNAGVAIYEEILKGDFEEERRLFEINFWGTRYASAIAVEAMEKGGTIITVGSELSEMAVPVLGMYSASKHALRAFTDSLRLELQMKDLPINVCMIRPTSIATPMPEHGAHRLEEGDPSLPSPLYHPDVVATMVLRCAVEPQRDVYVGAQARLSSITATLFPAFADAVARFRASAIKQGMARPHKEEDENLHHDSKSEGRTVGRFDRLILKRSLYSDLTTLGVGGTLRSMFKDLTR